MRLRDRRAALAALVLAAAYLGFLLSAMVVLVAWFAGAVQPSVSPILPWLLMINFILLVWRLLVRMGFVCEAYGAMEALRSIPRTVVGNFIALFAAQRAVFTYVRHLRGAPLGWDKTVHRFPDEATETG
jgi:adsorption protein B